MTIELSDARRAFLSAAGHLLITGGPGAGKTTLALLLAKDRCEQLEPGQGTLFLSFSREAVRQIVERSQTILTRQERASVTIGTYHKFCLDVLLAHGRLLTSQQARFLAPGAERIRALEHGDHWDEERRRLATVEGLYCFDEFARSTAELLERSRSVQELYADRYPTIILDEFQDTADDQWRLVQTLARGSQAVVLADPDQRIFEYRPDVRPERLEQVRGTLSPRELGLGSDNHRSPGRSILEFADRILNNRGPLPKTSDVRVLGYNPRDSSSFDSLVHVAVVWTFSALRKQGIKEPCVAVLARSNWMVEVVAAIFSGTHEYNGKRLDPIPHDVEWDAELTAAAGEVVGSILEWPSKGPMDAAAATADAIGQYFRMKGAETGGSGALKRASQLRAAATALREGTSTRIKAANQLRDAARAGIRLVGDPVRDWITARAVLEACVPYVLEVARASRMVRLFRATDAIGERLSGLWLAHGGYNGAASLIRRTLDRERLIGRERQPRGCILMNFHKSKGKEFDAVVLVEGSRRAKFFNEEHEPEPFEASRRILRVAITRASHLVTMVRPFGARSLVD